MCIRDSSYTGGVVSWWSYASLYLVTLPWIFFFVSRLRSLKLFTIAEFYQKRFPGRNGAIQYLVGGGFALKYCMMMGLQFNALAFLFTTVLGWTHVQGVLVSAAIILFYTGISGFLSVMVTNFIQSVFQTLCPFLMLGFVLHSLGGWQPVAQFYLSLIHIYAGDGLLSQLHGQRSARCAQHRGRYFIFGQGNVHKPRYFAARGGYSGHAE